MFRRLRAAAAVLLTVSACTTSKSTPSSPSATEWTRADLVLTGGIVLAGAGSNATAIAIEAGKIMEVGSDEAMKPWIGDGTRVIALEGRTVLPGLVDAHAHLASLGARKSELDLVGTNSLGAIQEKLAEAVEQAEPGAWIRGRGWDQNDWEGFDLKRQKFPSAADLDKIAPDNPVVLTRIDGHAIWVNTKAMKVAGIDAKTKISGGEIVKLRGRPSGIFIDGAIALISKHVPSLAGAELEKALLSAQEECIRAGLTQVHDMGVDTAVLTALEKIDTEGKLSLRVYALHDWTGKDDKPALDRGPLLPSAGGRLTVRGVKLMIDGALGSRGAALLAPYSDDKKNKGLLQIESEEMERRVREADAKGFQVATHAIGDRGNRIMLDIYQKVFGADRGKKRPRIEHAQVVAPEDLRRFGELGVIASMQPTHATSDMPWAEQRVGKERIKGAYAWHSLLTSNATIAAGSDAPVEDISPILGLYAAITRKDDLGEPAGGWYPEQRMTPEQAIDAFTVGANWAAFEEDRLGKIEKGHLADLTVLDRNPLTSDESALLTTRVEMTIIGGAIEYTRSATISAAR